MKFPVILKNCFNVSNFDDENAPSHARTVTAEPANKGKKNVKNSTSGQGAALAIRKMMPKRNKSIDLSKHKKNSLSHSQGDGGIARESFFALKQPIDHEVEKNSPASDVYLQGFVAGDFTEHGDACASTDSVLDPFVGTSSRSGEERGVADSDVYREGFVIKNIVEHGNARASTDSVLDPFVNASSRSHRPVPPTTQATRQSISEEIKQNETDDGNSVRSEDPFGEENPFYQKLQADWAANPDSIPGGTPGYSKKPNSRKL